MVWIGQLPPEFRASAVDLLHRCNSAEGLDLPISFGDSLATAAITEFAAVEGERLVGFALMPDDRFPEACLMVDPDLRRRGIGRALLAELRTELVRRGHESCLLVSDEASPSGRAFLLSQGTSYESAEYRLELDRTKIDRSRPRIPGLHLRRAEPDDHDTLIAIRMSGFGDSFEETAPAISEGMAEVKRSFYLAELDVAPIGMIRAGEWDGTGDITSFAVLPEFRGRGYGRQILLDTVDLLIEAGWERILIEVATDNDGALGLYRSCGFQVTNQYGYYRFTA